jgi:very-short-patch-repair endonuclease
MNTFIDNLIRDWAWRVNDGMPDPKNRDHIGLLEDTLRDLKYSDDFISEYITQLRENQEEKPLDDKEKERRSLESKKRWHNMSKDKQLEIRSKATEAIRTSAVEGSKMEKHIADKIRDLGYKVELHKKIIPKENLEVDLYIPELNTIIEVDGPSHFYPIWGQEKLEKQINADLRKSGALLSKGFAILRVKSCGEESLAEKTRLTNIVLEKIKDIGYNFPVRSKRFIEVE